MRWFKHLSRSFDDEKLSRLVDEAGLEGYGFWWRTLEIIATNSTDDHFKISYSIKKLSKLYGISAKKCAKLVGVLKSCGLISAEFFENGITMTCPNLAKFRDEYGRKKKKTPDKLRTNSGQTPDSLRSKDTDTDTDTDKKKGISISKKQDIEIPARNDASDRSRPKKKGLDLGYDWESFSFTGITERLILRWEAAYPALDIPVQIEEAAAWLAANPKNDKKNYTRFLVNWFSRAQQRAPRVVVEGADPRTASSPRVRKMLEEAKRREVVS